MQNRAVSQSRLMQVAPADVQRRISGRLSPLPVSPRLTGQRAISHSIQNSPFVAGQRNHFAGLTARIHNGSLNTAPAVQGKFEWDINEKNDKEQALKTTLERGLRNTRWGQLIDDPDFLILVTVDSSPEPNPAEVSPPSTGTTEAGRKIKYVHLGVRRWFVESYSIGTTVGMLNHEIGVHVMPYYRKIKENLEDEREGSPGRHEKEDLSAREKAGIDDHARAMVTGSQEFEIYLSFALTSAAALQRMGREDDARDVLFAYLMDLAAMAENGSKLDIAWKAMVSIGTRQAAISYVTERYNELAPRIQDKAEAEGLSEIFGEIDRVSAERVQSEFEKFRSHVPIARAALQVARRNPGKTFGLAVALVLICWLIYAGWTKYVASAE